MFSDALQRSFKEARAGEFDRLPDGEYTGVLEDVTLKIIGDRKDKKLMLTFDIVAPEEFEGRKHFHLLSLDNPNAMGILKFNLHRLGLDTDKIELNDVVDSVTELIGSTVFFLIQTNEKNDKKYSNTKIQLTKPKQVEDDDIPFDIPL